jgi:hypothetical protein
VGRRRFDHLLIELSLALGVRVPRYPLWLFLRERGLDPEALGREDVSLFCHHYLDDALAILGETLGRRARRRLARRCLRYDPAQPSPEEFMARLGGEDA